MKKNEFLKNGVFWTLGPQKCPKNVQQPQPPTDSRQQQPTDRSNQQTEAEQAEKIRPPKVQQKTRFGKNGYHHVKERGRKW